MNINKINHKYSNNVSKVKKILMKKKKQINIDYKTLNTEEIENINNEYKKNLIVTLSKNINNAKIINYISSVLDDYNVEKKQPIPEFISNTYDVIKSTEELKHKKQEFLILLTLGWSNQIINKTCITKWLLNQSLIHPREIFAPAIKDRANAIVIVHNHPSGEIKPSNADMVATNRIKDVSDVVWIKLLDHVIITNKWHFSFKENNIL